MRKDPTAEPLPRNISLTDEVVRGKVERINFTIDGEVFDCFAFDDGGNWFECVSNKSGEIVRIV